MVIEFTKKHPIGIPLGAIKEVDERLGESFNSFKDYAKLKVLQETIGPTQKQNPKQQKKKQKLKK